MVQPNSALIKDCGCRRSRCARGRRRSSRAFGNLLGGQRRERFEALEQGIEIAGIEPKAGIDTATTKDVLLPREVPDRGFSLLRFELMKVTVAFRLCSLIVGERNGSLVAVFRWQKPGYRAHGNVNQAILRSYEILERQALVDLGHVVCPRNAGNGRAGLADAE